MLTTISVGGTILTNANNVASFHANNTGSGNITLIDTASLLTITGITNTGSSGNVTLINSGNVTVSDNITTPGTVSLTGNAPAGSTVTVNALISGSGRLPLRRHWG